MNAKRLSIVALMLVLVACQSIGNQDTIAKLRHMDIEIKEEHLEGGLDKAMRGYQHFLEKTPESNLTPEAIRRLADLKIEKEYGTLTEGENLPASAKAAMMPAAQERTELTVQAAATMLPAPERTMPAPGTAIGSSDWADNQVSRPDTSSTESEAIFEKRATVMQPLPEQNPPLYEHPAGVDDLERANAREAIALYSNLLNDYPLYERNDQVLYQMSRAYEELGQPEEAMTVMDRMVGEFPSSRYIDEVQFRRAERFFAHKDYLDAEEAYMSIVNTGVSSSYYELALYKLGWTFYKQELYEDGLHRFIALLDHKVAIGYDFAQTEDEAEHKRTQDTFRVISLSFSNLGGSESVVEYFTDYGQRSYEDSVYQNLAEFYFDKRRYADASATYNAFVSRNPFHKVAPNYHMRVIEIHTAGGFPSLVLESKKEFATTYGLNAEYWEHYEPTARPDVLKNLKTNLTDLANHYHASYQDPRQKKAKPGNYKEALHWYREFLSSFPQETESPKINYQLADLLLENQSFEAAAVEYEQTAYGYPNHAKSSQAGYAAVFAYRKHLGGVATEQKDSVKREVVRSSLKFSETFPQHEKAAVVLGAAADDLYGMAEYEQALTAANRLLEVFPDTEVEVVRSAWLVIAHSSYEVQRYDEAEGAYLQVLDLLPQGDKTRDDLVNNLAASIYKQGELANAAEDYRAAADHFLRVGRMAPTSTIRASAEYDGAVALIQLEDWVLAAEVLVGFRENFPEHELQHEVTQKMAFVYRENGQLALAATEYERIETESQNDELRREALLTAAELHEKSGNRARTLVVYRRFVSYFPQPVEINLETRNKIAHIYKDQNERAPYLDELRQIVAIDAAAGPERTPRTRYLAATAGLVLAQTDYDAFVAVKLERPFKVNLRIKQERMKTVTDHFNRLIEYEIGEITAAATFYLAEIYAHFSQALLTSERPHGLSPLELEEYELAIEEQAYPFEDKAIMVHERNLELIALGVYNQWIDKSLQKLAQFLPARYDKPEEPSPVMRSLDTFVFEVLIPVATLPPDPEAEMEGEEEVELDPAAASNTVTEAGDQIVKQTDETRGEPETVMP